MGTTKNAWKTQTISSLGPTKSLNQPHHYNALMLVLEWPHWLGFGSIDRRHPPISNSIRSSYSHPDLLLIHSTQLSSREEKLLGFVSYRSAPSPPDLDLFPKTYFSTRSPNIGIYRGCTTCCSLAATLRENGERMRKWRGNGESMRKWWLRWRFTLDISPFSLYFLSLSFFVAKCWIRHFCRDCQKKLTCTSYEKIILGQICCEKAPQVVPA